MASYTGHSGKTSNKLSVSGELRKKRSRSWGEKDNDMAPDENRGLSKKGSTPRLSNARYPKGDSPKKTINTSKKGGGAETPILNRGKVSNGLETRSSSREFSDDSEEGLSRPLVSILKVPGRARSKSLPPSIILQQMSEGMSSLGPGSKLGALLQTTEESSEDGSTENLGPPPSYFTNQRRVSFSLPLDQDVESCSGRSTPSPYNLLPPLGGNGRLSPSLINAEQGNPRKGSPYPFDGSSSESLDSERSASSRPSSSKNVDILRDPLPTGSSIFQRAMADFSDNDNEDEEDGDHITLPPRTRRTPDRNHNTRNLLSPRPQGLSKSVSPRRKPQVTPRKSHSKSVAGSPQPTKRIQSQNEMTSIA